MITQTSPLMRTYTYSLAFPLIKNTIMVVLEIQKNYEQLMLGHS